MKSSDRADGLTSVCKACIAERRAALKAGAKRVGPWRLPARVDVAEVLAGVA